MLIVNCFSLFSLIFQAFPKQRSPAAFLRSPEHNPDYIPERMLSYHLESRIVTATYIHSFLDFFTRNI